VFFCPSAGTVLEALLAWWLLNSYGWRPLLLASVGPLGESLQEGWELLVGWLCSTMCIFE
jgi:hypothetical protein